jgi:hypothetical protein
MLSLQLLNDANADPDFDGMSWLVKSHPSVAMEVLDHCISKDYQDFHGTSTDGAMTSKFLLLMPKEICEDMLFNICRMRAESFRLSPLLHT